MEFNNDIFSVLIIDEDELILDALTERLQCMEYHVHTATSGAESIAKVSNGICPDLLITDYRLRDRYGVDVVKSIREFLGEEIPAIIFSNDESESAMEAARQNRCIFLHKTQERIYGSKVYHLIYISDATHQLNIKEIQNIAEVSQKNNLQADVTGILMFRFGKFMQFLEGSEEEVRRIFSVIKKDPRHTNIQVLTEGFIPKRQFSDWHMRYTPLSDIQVNGGIIFRKLFDFSDSTIAILKSAKESLSMLLAFKSNQLIKPSKL